MLSKSKVFQSKQLLHMTQPHLYLNYILFIIISYNHSYLDTPTESKESTLCPARLQSLLGMSSLTVLSMLLLTVACFGILCQLWSLFLTGWIWFNLILQTAACFLKVICCMIIQHLCYMFYLILFVWVDNHG